MYPKIDFFIGLIMALLSTVGYYIAGTLPAAKKGLGPGDYPRVMLVLLFILGSLLAITSFLKFRKNPKPEKSNYEKGEFKQVFLLASCTAVYIKMLAYFGYLLLTPLFMFIMLYIFGLRKWIKMVVLSLITGVFTFILFNNFLYVLLPRFILF